ncbi:Tn3 family transposase [Streptomyces sp. NPDC012825]|uniref:Tn3 family transposase n=1 Tax=Streptomyces sp. NPDC012825 TaxID=3364851 RepID=UPI0036BE3AFC
MREELIPLPMMLEQVRSASWETTTCASFREVGCVIRAVHLLRQFTDAPLRWRVAAAMNEAESFDRFSQRVGSAEAGPSPTIPSGRGREWNSTCCSRTW